MSHPRPFPNVALLPADFAPIPALPFFTHAVGCGFPSPAADFEETRLDVAAYLIQRPAATFFVRFQGRSLIDAGIFDGDIGIVDRSLAPLSGRIIVGTLDGDLVAKRFKVRGQRAFLEPANTAEETRALTPDSDFHYWGVVTFSIRRHDER